MLLDVSDTHTHSLMVYLSAINLLWTVSFFIKLQQGLQGLTPAFMNSHTLFDWVYVLASQCVQTLRLQDCNLEIVLNKICERRGSVQEKSGVHCVCKRLCALVYTSGYTK